MRLTINIEGIDANLSTRAVVAPEQYEDKITSLYLLFFTPNLYKEGRFIDYVEVDVPENARMNNIIVDIDVTDKPLLDAATAYNILAITNIDDSRYLGENDLEMWLDRWSGRTEGQVMAEAFALVMENTAIEPETLLMNGRIEKAAEQTQIDLVLTRNVARFDVLKRESVRDDYDLVSVSIWNAYPLSSVWGDGTMDYTVNAERIRRYYGISNDNVLTDGKMADVRGGLYAFENRVVDPKRNDRQTTCLIVGLRARDGSEKITYYRANIHSPESQQILRRNSAYRITITNVNWPGADTEDLAYTGQGNTLEYTMNEWLYDPNGLIVQDSYSVLAIPAKTIRIGQDGGEFSYSIFISNKTGTNPALRIKSQVYDAEGITASLNGNILTIKATPIRNEDAEDERRGVVTLQYAGLENSINIIQTRGVNEDYLNVYLPDGGIPQFSAFAGGASGLIRVEASGPWTAKLYMDGFSFNSALPPAAAVKEMKSTDPYVMDGRFRIYAYSENDTILIRRAFAVITLDSDDKFTSVIQISQDAGLGIRYNPLITPLVFNGVGRLKSDTEKDSQTFNVYANEVNDSPGDFENWFHKIIPTESGFVTDASKFIVLDYNNIPPQGMLGENFIQVKAEGTNTSGRNYNAILRLYQTDDGTETGTMTLYSDIILVQEFISIGVTPSVFPIITAVGDSTGFISVNASLDDPAARWKASVTTHGTAGGRSLVQHRAILKRASDNTIINPDDTHAMSERFYVVLPKVYYPNRDIPVTATVSVTVGAAVVTFTVNQSALTARPMVGYGLNGAYLWGALGNTYNVGWDAALATIPTYVRSGAGALLTAAVPANVAYLHVVPLSNVPTYNWANVNAFIEGRDAWTVISAQGSYAPVTVNNANSPLKRALYPNIIYADIGATNAVIHTATESENPKLYQFLMGRRNSPTQAMLNPATVASFHNDGTHTTIPVAGLPESAVVIMSKDGRPDRAQLVIDMKNKFMYIGESQIFWNAANLTNNRSVFLDNLMFFIGNASKYGSHFTDMLREDLAVPAPWDPHWGANAGVSSK